MGASGPLAGLAVAIPCYIGYNYLVSRVNQIVLDMEKSSNEILNLVTGEPTRENWRLGRLIPG